MKKNMMRTTALLLAALITLSACAKSEPMTTGGAGASQSGQTGQDAQGGGPAGEVDKNKVWREEEIDFSDTGYTSDELGQGIAANGSSIYLFGMKELDKSGRSECAAVIFDADGAGMETLVLDETERRGIWYGPFCVADDGAIYAVKTEYPAGWYEDDGLMDEDLISSGTMVTDGDVVIEEPEADDGENTEDEQQKKLPGGADDDGTDDMLSDEEVETYYIVKFDAAGEKVFETKLEPDKPENADMDWYSVNGLVMAGDGTLLINDNYGVYSCNTEDGTRDKKIHDNGGDYTNLIVSGAGDVYLVEWGSDGMELLTLDVAAGKDGEKISLGTQMFMYDVGSAKPAAGNGFLLTENGGISAWNIGDDAPVQLVNFVDSDIEIDYVESVVQTAEDEMVIFYYRDSYGRVCTRLKKVAPEDVKEKETIVLGTNGLDTALRSAIVQFNKASDDVRISVRDYSTLITDDNWDAGYTQMNNDIIAGNAPDIMMMDSGNQTRSYVAKGLLEPLDSYMENDPEISKAEYADSILDVFRYQGKTYLLTPSFAIRTYAIKKRDADAISEWSLDELQRLMRERNIDVNKVFGDWPMTQNDIVLLALAFDGKNYFDWDEHRVKFDSKSFIDLLNFAKQFPADVDYGAFDEDTSGYYRTGEALVAQAYFSSFRDFRTLKYGTFGEDIVLIGFPREDGSGGSSVMPYEQLTMSTQSKNKEACWSFMRTFLLEDYQKKIVEEMNYMFPVMQSQLEAMAKKSLERDFYINEDGEEEYYEESTWINGEEIKLGMMTQADVDQMFDMFHTVDSAFEYDMTLINMVQEECAPFFEGQKSAEECAKIVQSKAQIYIDENS